VLAASRDFEAILFAMNISAWRNVFAPTANITAPKKQCHRSTCYGLLQVQAY
jgi:hypothetical protein